MPPSKISDGIRDKIVALVQAGKNWSEIEREIGIDRRTAKSAYKKWERNSSVEELKKVRQEIAAVEFRTHMESMVTLATTLLSNIILPSSIIDMKSNSQEFLEWFWQQDLLLRQQEFIMRYSSSPNKTIIPVNNKNFRIEDQKIYYDEKILLFKSLRDHTRGEVKWDVLDNDWKNARDNCANGVSQLIKDTRQLVDDYIKVANAPGFLEKVKKVTKKNEPAKNITEAIVNVMWRSITRRELINETPPSFKAVTKDKSENVNVVAIRSGDENLFSFIGEDKQYLAEKIQQVCNMTIKKILIDNKIVWELNTEVGNMIKASDDLRVMLNPLKLRPMILRTRCELCPI
jgi:hypothetical protein